MINNFIGLYYYIIYTLGFNDACNNDYHVRLHVKINVNITLRK
jgi:hypothetical protein